jgi:hypothetical protein
MFDLSDMMVFGGSFSFAVLQIVLWWLPALS